ncbi:MAG: flagellar filament capping protein FliD, partial [Pseudomonadota bacterium]|nr:flagellar filament capping protein FliD [Pseudomonadota bacterium]
MSISSLGIGSGVLTADLVDQLVEAERGPTEKRLDSQEEVLNAQVSEFGALKGLVSDFESSVSALNLSSSFKNNTASSTNENAVTATASSVASPGLYTIEVDSLAQRQTIASLEFSNLNDIVGEGTLKFTFGTVGTTRDANGNVTSFDSFTANTSEAVKTLKVDATNHTVTGLRDAINKSDLGISATIVDTGSGYRLLLQSQDSGEDNGFKVEVSNASNGLDGFNFNETTTGAGLLHTGLASDAQFKVNGLNVTREDNLVAGVINGVTLNLKQTTSGPVNLTIERDTAAVASKMSDLVDSYNALKGRINELTQFDTEEGKGSL